MNRSAPGRSMLDPDSTALLNPGASPLIDREARTGLAAVLASERPPAAAHAILSLLERLQVGRLLVTTPAGASLSFGHGEPHASIRLANWKVFGASLSRGDIGFAESWISGDWQTDSLPALLKLLLANRDVIDRAIYGHWWGQALYRIKHLLNRNSKAGSRRNIHAHYDLGNPFYAVWLDPSMTYSSALFGNEPARSLQDAQTAKYRRILDQLALPPGARVLEIGCGWGGFAELAARDGLHVTGLTLSTEQHAWATRRLADAGLADQARFLLQDYRDEKEQFDAIVSIEMFEAVGERYWPSYFETLRRCLRPGGRAVVQTITIDDTLFERYRRGTDFIQQYIFPGGMLPSPEVFSQQARAAGLAVDDAFGFGLDYARTLAIWRDSFLEALPQITAQGFDTRFARTWEFYLAYCEAGFAQRSTDVVQFTLRREG
ncbi:MAG: cyclopropane-fatty-acyl-phospholipid synthase [Burkholderiales bacterium]|nr:cyclopropane-fatty-acyl-phospholipid synthase [Burkholderiales bacterium]